MTQDALAEPIETSILALTHACSPGKSISPHDVAHAVARSNAHAVATGPEPAWQGLLPAVRRAAVRLAQAGRIDILRKGKPADPATVKGVIRLRASTVGGPG